jgi:Zn-dependent protease/CBS domain-containing protein
MRQGSIRLGRIAGVPLSMDLGVLVVGGLLTWILASAVLPNGAPGLVGSVYWSVAIVGAVLFLASLLAHELAHAVVARRNGVQVRGITLWLFGGFAQFDDEPPTPGAEFRITAAGPATSLGLAALFGAAAFGLAMVGAPEVYTTLLMWLGIINGFLGVFNLLPGAPLDGGRILAAALWKLRGDRVAGRIGAATVGKFVGAALIGLGVFEMLAIRGFGGLWTAFIGWFLFSAARAEHVHFSGERALGDLTVGEAMSALGEPVRSWASVAELVDGPLRATHRSSVPVTDFSGRVVGVVSMADVRGLPAERWSGTTVLELVGDEPLPAVDASERLSEVLARGVAGPRGHVLVTSGGRVVGLVGPDEVRRAIELGRLRGDRPRQRSTPPPPPVAAPRQRWDPPVPTR